MLKWCLLGLFTLANWLSTDKILLANIPPPDIAVTSYQLPVTSPAHAKPGLSRQFPVTSSQFIQSSKQQNCPADLENLTDELLKNLPSYVNRVIQRGRRLERDVYSYVIVAGNPEFKPIDLNQLQYTPVFPESTQQVFFTTLEREHGSGSTLTTQHYHWLFLTQTTSGWRLVMLFSRSSSTTPLRESSNSAIGEGIRLWLRDCRAPTR